jgi:hypothetical protein
LTTPLLTKHSFKKVNIISVPVFQVVRFPNDICVISGGTKNGTCYTAEECSSKGGVNGGTCASGFGVCCTFTVGCGTSSSENCTYFEVVGAVAGACVSQICVSDDVCQVRLDFDTFVITGPSTNTLSVGKELGGGIVPAAAAGKGFSYQGQCLTDAFVVGGTNVPTLCGTLTGDHIYFDVSQACHSMDFSFGQNALGLASAVTNRRFSIHTSLIPCSSPNKAPTGCLQWFTGTSGTGSVSTFNYAEGEHLGDQVQTICFRREQGYCRICFSADAAIDIALGGKAGGSAMKGLLLSGSQCCGYGAAGVLTVGVYDCLVIPGAEKAASPFVKVVGAAQCAGGKGIVDATDTAATVCSRTQPFSLSFISDGFGLGEAGGAALKGFKVTYWQSNTC